VNAVLPLAKKLKERFPDAALIVSTTTKTGQKVARAEYAGISDMVVYFPFDFTWAVKRFLRNLRPNLVLLTETELWFNFIRLAADSGARVCMINGRLSHRSFARYSRIRGFMKRLLSSLSAALMQTSADADRMIKLGAESAKVKITGNLKFDIDPNIADGALTREFRDRYGIDEKRPLILAASTHAPEEKLLLDTLKTLRESHASPARLMLVPRHPERFDEVARLIDEHGFTAARRSSDPTDSDTAADIILLDSIGELRAAYPLAEIVFVGGSLIPHGGQSIFEPAAARKAIVTGPFTANFDAAVKEFLTRDALIQLPDASLATLVAALSDLLTNTERRDALAQNALAAMEANRGAVDRTLEYLAPFLSSQ
jgi:3-deoxy-D-manno-octulosonic-acid transferase